MRSSDILVLPGVEEGSALVTSDARRCGCVLLVSEASGAICKQMENAMVHEKGDVRAFIQHMSLLNEDRALLERMRESSRSTAHEITWGAAGQKLLQIYRDTLAEVNSKRNASPNAA